jgi:ribonuclease Y
VFNLDPRWLQSSVDFTSEQAMAKRPQHSVEMAHLSRMIAEETGANIQVAVAGALVHDIGKHLHMKLQVHTLKSEKNSSKFGVSEEIIKLCRPHEEYPYETLESIIVHIADNISGSRRGQEAIVLKTTSRD